MSHFTITFLGASGGPADGLTCATLIKPHNVSYNDIVQQNLSDQLICIDAGSGFSQLSEIIYDEINLPCAQFSSPSSSNSTHEYSDSNASTHEYYASKTTGQQHQQSSSITATNSRLLRLYNDSLPFHQYFKSTVTTPFKDLCLSISPFKHTQNILHQISTFLITHPHLDHISALTVNSAGFSASSPKLVYGSAATTNALQKHIFNGVIWPDMTKFNIIKLIETPFWHSFQVNNNTYTVTMFDLSHGKLVRNHDNHALDPLIASCSNPSATSHHRELQQQQQQGLEEDPNIQVDHYLSSAFFITHNASNVSILAFGDFESDVASQLDKNKRIWSHVAPLVIGPNRCLKGIIMECSLGNVNSNGELYGHLIPTHLINELNCLRNECVKLLPPDQQYQFEPLKGLHVIITHVKEACNRDSDPRKEILNDLETLNAEFNLQVLFTIAVSGVSIEI